MERLKVQVRDEDGRIIEILENYGVIEEVNGLGIIAAVESPIVALFVNGSQKFHPDQVYYSNFRKENNGTLTIII